jgi:hypothetical protein
MYEIDEHENENIFIHTTLSSLIDQYLMFSKLSELSRDDDRCPFIQ